jgi:hypothetical protein
VADCGVIRGARGCVCSGRVCYCVFGGVGGREVVWRECEATAQAEVAV